MLLANFLISPVDGKFVSAHPASSAPCALDLCYLCIALLGFSEQPCIIREATFEPNHALKKVKIRYL